MVSYFIFIFLYLFYQPHYKNLIRNLTNKPTIPRDGDAT